MKLNELIFLVIWLLLGLLINHYIVNDGQKLDINIGKTIEPSVYTLTLGNICGRERAESSSHDGVNAEGCDTHAS